MMFRRSTAHYGETPAPETPFQKAAQVWDDRIGSARVQAANWRYIALGCLALSFLTSGALIWRSMQSTVTPYVVEVDKLGVVQAIGPAALAYDPTDAQIAHHLARFLENFRGLSVDPVVVRQNWLAAYAYTTDRGAMVLNDYAREYDPFAEIGRKSRTVDVASIVRVSGESFQARWVERTYENGANSNTEHFTAVLTVATQTPRDAETLRNNPLGIFVHTLNWAEDLDMGEE